MGKPRQFRALEHMQYEFDFDAAPLREHRLYAYATSDKELSRATNAKLRKDFEEHFKFPAYDPIRCEWRIKRLKGFMGDRRWKRGTLIFSQRGPEIPFFGLDASQLCRDVPIMYTSCTQDGQETEARYFFNGEEYFDGMPSELARKFAALNEKQWGIIRVDESAGAQASTNSECLK